jgi:hypothetical protein
MDVSSRYFSLLKKPSLQWPVYLWHFLEAIRRVGKQRELISFALWEVIHRLHLYQFHDQYVKFTDAPYHILTDKSDWPDQQIVPGLSIQPVAVNWKYCIETPTGLLWGCCFSDPNALYRSDDQSQSVVLVHRFKRPVTSFFTDRQNTLFICSDGAIHRSDDQGQSFDVVLQLSTPISYFLFNNGMTELPDGTLLIGEYGSIWHGRAWQNLAYLYYSTDAGITWHTADFLLRQGVNKHIHLVRYSTLLNALFLTDGDNKKQAWINSALNHFDNQSTEPNSGWRLLNQYHHQTGGYMSMAETDEAVLFGSDYLGGTNFMVRTEAGRQFERYVLPDPYRRSPIMNMVSRQTATGTEIWAISYSCLSANDKSLLMYTRDSGKTWLRVLEFDGTRNEVRLVNSSRHPSDSLYISVTTFDSQFQQHRHKVYRLDCADSL